MNKARVRAVCVVGLLLPFDCMVAAAILLSELVRAPLSLLKKSRLPVRLPDTRRVTIQILNWDGRHLLEEFLPSVLLAAGRHEVVVVDNGSRDGSVQFLKDEFPQVRIVELDRNYGFATGNNLGVELVQSDIVVFLNNDMSVEPEFLEPLLLPFTDSSVFAVASRIYVPDPAKAHHETGKTRAVFEKGFFYFWHDPVSPGDEGRTALPVFWAGGGACAVDRRKYLMAGGFDSLYHPFYVEDADLSYQAWKRGWKSLLAPSSRVLHKHRGTSRPRFGDDFVNNTTRRNFYLLVWKNVTDFGMILEHLFQLPSIHGRAIMAHGARFELRAYLRAVLRLPFALWRRAANARAYRLSDREVLKSAR